MSMETNNDRMRWNTRKKRSRGIATFWIVACLEIHSAQTPLLDALITTASLEEFHVENKQLLQFHLTCFHLPSHQEELSKEQCCAEMLGILEELNQNEKPEDHNQSKQASNKVTAKLPSIPALSDIFDLGPQDKDHSINAQHTSHMRKLCQEQVAPIPYAVQQQEQRIPTASYYWSIFQSYKFRRGNNDTTVVQHVEDALKETTFARHMIGGDIHAHSDVKSPFHLADSLLENEVNRADPTQESVVPSIVSSVVEDEAGMHRHVIHQIQIPIGTWVVGNASMVLLWPVSQYTFINLDDPYEAATSNPCQVISDPSYNCHIDLLHQGIIDIEQPSFASGQHVVAFALKIDRSEPQIQNDISNKEEKEISSTEDGGDLKLILTTMLHTRYLAPTCETATLRIATPVVFSGAINTTKNTTVKMIPSSNEQLLLLEVPTGCMDDYDFVMMATMGFSVVGSLVMLQFMTQASQWPA